MFSSQSLTLCEELRDGDVKICITQPEALQVLQTVRAQMRQTEIEKKRQVMLWNHAQASGHFPISKKEQWCYQDHCQELLLIGQITKALVWRGTVPSTGYLKRFHDRNYDLGPLPSYLLAPPSVSMTVSPEMHLSLAQFKILYTSYNQQIFP